jgi:DNA ligase-associated metallophosphoesterase
MRLANWNSGWHEQKMNGHSFFFAGLTLTALPSGALWWPEPEVLAVSDLHLGKSERVARRGGTLLPPYEVHDTLQKLDDDINITGANTVICLGDSFDDVEAADSLTEDACLWITRLQAGRRWIWIEGNHDAGPTTLGGTHFAALDLPPLTFRHIAKEAETAEISGHYHPKAALRVKGHAITRACFLYDETRVILPAYGTFTGGLQSTSEVFARLLKPEATAILIGPKPIAIPMPRKQGVPDKKSPG